MVAAGLHGRALFVAGLCYCGAHLTDGMIPKAAVPMLVAEAGVKAAAAAKLVEVGSWIDHGDTIEVHDYLVYNPSREQVRNDRQTRERKRNLHSDAALVQAIRRRDLNECRYCGCAVSWKDRRGPRGATYDHVDPDGPNTLDNVVVACRGCNSAKGHRTPEEAGMDLLGPSSDLDQKPKRNRTRSSHPTPSPVIETPTESLSEQPPARRVAIQHWEATDPKPVLSGGFIALVKLCERFVDAGHTEAEVLAALSRTRAYTLDSISFSLNEGRKNGRPSNVDTSLANISKALLQ